MRKQNAQRTKDRRRRFGEYKQQHAGHKQDHRRHDLIDLAMQAGGDLLTASSKQLHILFPAKEKKEEMYICDGSIYLPVIQSCTPQKLYIYRKNPNRSVVN
jgi:hypothetical protein